MNLKRLKKLKFKINIADKQEFQKDFYLFKVLYFILHQMDKEELGVTILLYLLPNK